MSLVTLCLPCTQFDHEDRHIKKHGDNAFIHALLFIVFSGFNDAILPGNEIVQHLPKKYNINAK